MRKNSQENPSLENLFEDFNHPNPNINYNSFLKMNEYWPEESMEKLMNNLDNKDVFLRRKSVKALGVFGEKILLPVSKLFCQSEDKIIRVSCLKVLIIASSNITLRTYPDEIIHVIKQALNEDSTEIILAVISFLRQLGDFGIPFLKQACRDENILKSRASVTAIGEIKEPSIEKFLIELVEDKSLDIIVREAAESYLRASL